MISISAMATVVFQLLIAGLVFWLCNWLIEYCGIPEPFNKVARIVIAIFAVFVCISVLLSASGSGFAPFRS